MYTPAPPAAGLGAALLHQHGRHVPAENAQHLPHQERGLPVHRGGDRARQKVTRGAVQKYLPKEHPWPPMVNDH